MDAVKVKEELKRGIEAANQLKVLLSTESTGKDEVLRACKNHHSAMILKAFDNALSMARDVQLNNPSNLDTKVLHNGPRLMLPVTITTDLREDGYTWRKYGRKPIVNAKHPREYYRCALKSQGCEATKKIQVIAENPTTYRIVYCGQHSCQKDQTLGDEIRPVKSFERDSVKMLNVSCSIESSTKLRRVCCDGVPTSSCLSNFRGQQQMKKIHDENKPCKPRGQDQNVESSSDPTAMVQLKETPLPLDADAGSLMLHPSMTSPYFVEEDFNYLVTGGDEPENGFLEIRPWD